MTRRSIALARLLGGLLTSCSQMYWQNGDATRAKFAADHRGCLASGWPSPTDRAKPSCQSKLFAPA